ncbi:hypothetical protein Tco_0257809 [Tanacetum coccineum]
MKPKPKRSTREVVHVPQDVIFDHILPRIPAKFGCRFRSIFGLYYSCCEDDYKFLFVDYFDHNVYIYSLKSDSWRKVDVFQHTLHPGSPSRGTYLNENLYFLKANSSGRLDSIISCDNGIKFVLNEITNGEINFLAARHVLLVFWIDRDIECEIFDFLQIQRFEKFQNSWTSRSAATGNGQKAHGAAAGGNAPVLGAPVWCLVIDLSTSTISSGPAQNPRNTPIANTTTSVIAMRGYGLWGGGDGKDNGNDDDNAGL